MSGPIGLKTKAEPPKAVKTIALLKVTVLEKLPPVTWVLAGIVDPEGPVTILPICIVPVTLEILTVALAL